MSKTNTVKLSRSTKRMLLLGKAAGYLDTEGYSTALKCMVNAERIYTESKNKVNRKETSE